MGRCRGKTGLGDPHKPTLRIFNTHHIQMSTGAKGYSSEKYADSLSEFGEPFYLDNCGGWVLKRSIPGTDYFDAMGLYPIFKCDRWDKIGDDIRSLEDIVSISIVTDPFGDFEENKLAEVFDNKCFIYKSHYVADLNNDKHDLISSHHRRNIDRAKEEELQVEFYESPIEVLDSWNTLYDHLIHRHDIKGINAFSHLSFRKQLRVPGCVAFAARNEGSIVSMLIWFEENDIAYYHLGASNPVGYDKCASFLLFDAAIDYYESSSRIRYMNYGGGAGAISDGKDGLSRFKRGWSSYSKKTYFCGHIFDAEAYAYLMDHKSVADSSYFPVYRDGEFK